MEQRQITSFDGTRIAYQVGGQGERWLVVANGYGGSFWAWEDLFALLTPRYRVLIWDYRGLYHSGMPEDPQRLTIADNCRDLDRLMQAEGIQRAVVCGWSVGVQVALEQFRRNPSSVEALVLINGSHGRVLHRSFEGRVAPLLLVPMLRTQALTPARVSAAALLPLRLIARSPRAVDIVAGLRLVTGKPRSVHIAMQDVLRLDQSRYARMIIAADRHDTEDMLHTVTVPTLVTSGSRDIITPPRVGRHIAARIPGAEHFVIPRATHYAVMEMPLLVANRIHGFISGRLDHPEPWQVTGP